MGPEAPDPLAIQVEQEALAERVRDPICEGVGLAIEVDGEVPVPEIIVTKIEIRELLHQCVSGCHV